MSPSSPARWRRLLGVVAACIVAACGGSGSVGSGGTGSVAVGTVTGFGSLVVDGVAFDDSRTVARVENEPGAETPAEVRLGHRVEVEFDEANVALAIRVEAGVRGPVANRTADGLVVLGQRIVVNTDATVGPLTQFGGGYAGLGDVSPADLVEVHGVLLPLAAGGPVIQATRIDRQESLSAWRVTGVVSERSDTGFRLGTQAVSTAGAQVVPAAARLADGQVVRVLAAPGDGAAPLQARQVRLRTVPERSRAQVSGAVAAHDPLARTFLAGPQKVSYS
ncbi:MAG TPA: DUF5666 domain-containing protein, partial [Gemmatimonadales bacterium]|nr:DUF5666 domain-containing protein [Gemmatimonadales bacterium]